MLGHTVRHVRTRQIPANACYPRAVRELKVRSVRVSSRFVTVPLAELLSCLAIRYWRVQMKGP
jgi:hypothetical protein